MLSNDRNANVVYSRHPMGSKTSDAGRRATSSVQTMAHERPDRIRCSCPPLAVGRHHWTRDVRLQLGRADGRVGGGPLCATDCRRIARPEHRAPRRRLTGDGQTVRSALASWRKKRTADRLEKDE